VQHLLTLSDFDPQIVARLFSDAARMKLAKSVGETFNVTRFAGRMLGLLFEKPSLRTRVSFETAMSHLGGSTIFLGSEVGWGERETIEDFARTLTRFVCAVVYRGKDHGELERFARYSNVPVINGLTPLAHPCQALSDLFTIQESFPDLSQVKLAFLGDSNNVARSLAWGCAMTGAELVVASPGTYRFDADFLSAIRDCYPAAKLANTDDPRRAVENADVVYTDVWASMGDEQSRETRKVAFRPFQVNAKLLSAAKPHAKFMHCLPARRGEEVTDEIIDGPQSVVFDQAENRMHIQQAILAYLLNQNERS
jgi:ornithine carbamoyltransferase